MDPSQRPSPGVSTIASTPFDLIHARDGSVRAVIFTPAAKRASECHCTTRILFLGRWLAHRRHADSSQFPSWDATPTLLSVLAGPASSHPESMLSTLHLRPAHLESIRLRPATATRDWSPLCNARYICRGPRLPTQTSHNFGAIHPCVLVFQPFSSYVSRSLGVVPRALTILILSSRSAWATISSRPWLDTPTVIYRCSETEWSGSGYVIAKASPNTVAASSNEIRCFRRFRLALPGSHSKITISFYPRPTSRAIAAFRPAAKESPLPAKRASECHCTTRICF